MVKQDPHPTSPPERKGVMLANLAARSFLAFKVNILSTLNGQWGLPQFRSTATAAAQRAREGS